MRKPSPSLYVACMNVMNSVAHVLMGGVAFFGIVLGDALPSKFAAHSFIICIGLTILCSQALLSVNPFKAYNDNFKFPKKSKTYWIVQIIGCAIVIIGAIVGISAVGSFTISVGPIQASLKHFSTAHGVIGLMVMIFVFVKLVGAIANLLISDRLNTLLKSIHVIVSIVTITLAYLTICIKYGDASSNLSAPAWAITFSVFTMLLFLLMNGARVFMTGSFNSE